MAQPDPRVVGTSKSGLCSVGTLCGGSLDLRAEGYELTATIINSTHLGQHKSTSDGLKSCCRLV